MKLFNLEIFPVTEDARRGVSVARARGIEAAEIRRALSPELRVTLFGHVFELNLPTPTFNGYNDRAELAPTES